MTKIITFDADNTLWDFSAMQERAWEAMLQALPRILGHGYEFVTREYIQERITAEFKRYDVQTIDYIKARRAAYRQALIDANVPDAEQRADEAAEVFFSSRYHSYTLYDDTISTLNLLRGQAVIGYITNGVSLPEEAGIADYFDFVITPDTLGVRKPEELVFQHAAKVGGAPIEDLMHVGDNLIQDVGGAIWAGGQGIWFNPNRAENPTNIQPTAEISQLREVLDLLDK